MKKKSGAGGSSICYGKAQLLTFERYAQRRDLLTAMLEDGKHYTFQQVDSLIDGFMKGKVN